MSGEVHSLGSSPIRPHTDSPQIDTTVRKSAPAKLGVMDVSLASQKTPRLELSSSTKETLTLPLTARTVQLSSGLDTVNRSLKEQVRHDALPTRQQLMVLAGSPKRDIRLFHSFGPVIHKMSTAYKGLLGQLDRYHGSLESGKGIPIDKETALTQLQGLRDQLRGLSESSEKYVADKGHTRSTALTGLQDQIGAELETVEGMLAELESGGNWPDGFDLQEALAYRREGFTGEESAQLKGGGLNPKEAREYLDLGFTTSQAGALKQAGLSPQEGRDFADQGINAHDGGLFRNAGIRPSEAKVYLGAGFTAGEAVILKTAYLTALDGKAYTEKGVNVQDACLYRQMGVTPEDAHGFVTSPGNYKAWTDLGFSGPEAVAYQKAGLKPADMVPFKGHHVPVQEAKEFLRLGIPFSPQIRVTHLRQENLTGPMKVLGSGAFNTVYKGTYSLPDGSRFAGVYKEEHTGKAGGYGWVAGMTGIDRVKPLLGLRNIATYRMANLFGFSVIPRTEFGIHEGKLGVVMGLAPGTSPIKDTTIVVTPDSKYASLLKHRERILAEPELAKKLAQQIGAKSILVEDGQVKIKGRFAVDINYKDPVLRRELVKLQLLDHLCAQGDRHPGNYFIEVGPDGKVSRVTGIDNDQAFGKGVRDPDGIQFRKAPLYDGFRGTKMPRVVDREMYDTFMAMTPERLEQELTGLVNPEEIAAAKDRLAGIKAHLQQLELAGHVIDPDQWGSSRVDSWLSDRDTSYVGRDQGHYSLNLHFGHLAVSYEEMVR